MRLALKAAPTQEDAVEALALLEDLLIEFPFVSPIDHSVALSMLMTTLLRASMTVAPFHLIRANDSGTGKSYMVDIASTIAGGRWAPAIDMNRDGDEVGKRLEAVLRSGQPIISLDNLEGEIGGAALCLFTERPLIELRPLGKTETVEIESRAACLGTGNNVTPTADIVRRTMVCDLDAAEERPELHVFNSDPLRAVERDRWRYVAAILTIARAYILAGCPPRQITPLPPLGSYRDWTRLVRAPLVWLGKPDPVESMEKIRTEDPDRNDMAELFALIDKQPFKARDLASAAERNKALHDVLMRVSDSQGSISTKALGRWLTRHQDKVVNGKRITRYSSGDQHGHRFVLTAIRE